MLQAFLGHLLDHVARAKGAGAPIAGGTLKSVHVENYGPGGKGAGSTVDIDCGNLVLDASGDVQEGNASLQVAYSGAKLSSSTAHFGTDGVPARVTSTIYDRHSGGVHRLVASDLSQLVWMRDRVSEGSLAVRVTDSGGTPVTEATFSYSNESLAEAHLTTYGPDGESVSGRVHMDFGEVDFLGREIVGGVLVTRADRPDGTLRSESRTAYSKLGLLLTIQLSVYESDGNTLRNNAVYDYSEVTFNGMREIDSGQLTIKVTAPTGRPLTTSTIEYRDAVPSTYRSVSYSDDGRPRSFVEVDYPGCKFNHDKRVVDGQLTTLVRNPDGGIRSRTVTTYGPAGFPTKSAAATYAPDGETVSTETTTDYNAAGFNRKGRVVSGVTVARSNGDGWTAETTSTYSGGADYSTRERVVRTSATKVSKSYKRVVKRPNGTLFEVVTVRMSSEGVPTDGTVTRFAVDGKTIVTSEAIQYSGRVTSHELLLDKIGFQLRDGKNRSLSDSVAAYG